MQLPNLSEAHVDKRKITRYLLNESHTDSGGKAPFFRALGYEPARWQELADALRAHAEDHSVDRTEDSPYGTKYIIEGPLRRPDVQRWVRVVWMIDHDETAPRLVTAYPIDRTDAP